MVHLHPFSAPNTATSVSAGAPINTSRRCEQMRNSDVWQSGAAAGSPACWASAVATIGVLLTGRPHGENTRRVEALERADAGSRRGHGLAGHPAAAGRAPHRGERQAQRRHGERHGRSDERLEARGGGRARRRARADTVLWPPGGAGRWPLRQLLAGPTKCAQCQFGA